MTEPVVLLENVGKLYRLGYIGTGTLREDVKGAWAKMRGKPNPNVPIGAEDNDGSGQKYIWALKDINLEIEKGEVFGIIGANGAGKSTLLKLLSRITSPTTGRIKMKGKVGSLLEVGTGFHPELTGRENVYLNGSILGMRKQEIDRKFDEIVSFAGVETYIDTPVKRYSSGMHVRLGFAVAAHLNPEILIVDEVLSVGDAEFQKKAIGKMSDVSGEGRTILFVSHNMNSVEALCTRACLLQNGKIIQIGEPSKIIQDYEDLYAKEGYILKGKDKEFTWHGVNFGSDLTVESDIPLEIDFETGNKEFTGANFDVTILDSKKNKIVHVKSRFVIGQINLNKNTHYRLQFTIESPRLAPGKYFIHLYIYDMYKNRMFGAENMDAFTISGKAAEGDTVNLYYDKLFAPILPNYQVSITES